MKIAPAFVLAAACLAARSLAAEDPTAVVKAALQDFLDQPNYTWGVGNTRGIPEENGDNEEPAADGQHEKGGYTKVNFRRGPHIPIGLRPSTKPWGYNDREDYWSSRWVFWTPEGWKLISELPRPAGLGPPSGPTGPNTKIIFSKRISLGSSFAFHRPDQEIALVLQDFTEATADGAGRYTVELTREGAARFFSLPRLPALLGSLISIRTENTSGSLSLRIRNGTLVSYELTLDGTRIFMDRSFSLRSTLIRELSGFGTTVIEVPEEVRRKLGND